MRAFNNLYPALIMADVQMVLSKGTLHGRGLWVQSRRCKRCRVSLVAQAGVGDSMRKFFDSMVS